MNAPSTSTRSCSRRADDVKAVIALCSVLLVPPGDGAPRTSKPTARAQAAPAGAQSGRGAQPASYPPYMRPVSTFVPPKTADGQPDISGLYIAIPLPRGIETPRVPMAGRGPNRANSEFSYSIN